MIKAISSNVAQYVTVKTFVEALRSWSSRSWNRSYCTPGGHCPKRRRFPGRVRQWSADKVDLQSRALRQRIREGIRRFPAESGRRGQRFAKLPEQFGFAIEYTDNMGNLRYYEPDFVVLTNDGTHYIAETKGLEDINVANKDRAAQLWCENTTMLTGKPWAYVKVLQTSYKQLQPTRFEDLLVLDQKKLL